MYNKSLQLIPAVPPQLSLKDVPDQGTVSIIGTLYVQKWFASDSKSIEITVDKKD